MRGPRGRAPRLTSACVLAAAFALTAPAGLTGQQGCSFIEGSGNLQTVDLGGGAVTYVTTPNLVCRDGVRIRADSAVAYAASDYVQLIGNVRFEDPDRRLTAQSAEYFSTVGRLQAHQGAELTQKTDGSQVRGDELIYNRADANRPRAQLDVYGNRPTARLRLGRDTTAAAAGDSARAPYDIEADRIRIEADSLFRAHGDVRIVRAPSRPGDDSLRAFGDSVEYGQSSSILRLMGRARMRIDQRELTAETITADLPGDEVREVVARRNALVTAEDIRLRAPIVRVYFEEGAMERLVAVPLEPAGPPAEPGPPGPEGALPAAGAAPREEDRARPVATAEDFTIVADSLDVLAPGEVLDRIHAVGGSRAESLARDSLNQPDTPRLARSDWMEGDTIVAQFGRVPRDSAAALDAAAPPADSTRDEYRLERLSASGRARSLYRMEPNDSAQARGDRSPAIHYVAATTIVLEWDDGEIRTMEVRGQTEGVHAEPAPPVADSAGAPADSARAAPDTARAPGAGGAAPPGARGSRLERAGPAPTVPAPALLVRGSRSVRRRRR